MYRIGIDIGGTKIKAGLFDGQGNLLAAEKAYIRDLPDLCVYIQDAVSRLAAQCGVQTQAIAACGIGIPGTVTSDGRRIVKAPNLPMLEENFAETVEHGLGIPTGLVQDSRAAAWGEYLYGGGGGMDSVVCITLGTGIGTGIVLDGRIYHGALGCAGEIGHSPAVPGGRPCGCGKYGCLERYCAGSGLDQTAEEILGSGSRAADLFSAAEAGNQQAQEAVQAAARMLGDALVFVINLMSPDCILFSGGLSAQEKQYTGPAAEYALGHCYNAGRLPALKTAELGENAPLYGAAYLPVVPRRRKPILSASIMCADILDIGAALQEIQAAGIEYLHCDIMDNHFVPNLMLSMELLNKLRRGTSLPFDFHIMAENPESIIEKLDIRPGDIIAVHYESTPHLQRAVELIHAKGARAAAAVNPATPVEVLSEILPQLDMILIMTVNPGFAGQKLVPGSIGKIQRAKAMLLERGLPAVLIGADGNCSFENGPKMYAAGADLLVVGTSSVFGQDICIEEGTKKMYAACVERR